MDMRGEYSFHDLKINLKINIILINALSKK